MKVEQFIEAIKSVGIRSFIGVPDSTLKQFCDYLNTDGKQSVNHYVTANEGAAVGMAVGAYMATGKPACVYMQNSGIGNIVNPVTSIANEEVYDIPMLFVTGWRGEPGKKDEPQHKFMGKITEAAFDLMNIKYRVIDGSTTEEELKVMFDFVSEELANNKQVAIIVKKDAFEVRVGGDYSNGYSLVREDAIAKILKSISKDDVVISTTGKISREVYEQSDVILGGHEQDFLTVGGMGHASMIACGYAIKRPDKKVYCIDGDGAVLMHMGSLAFVAKEKPDNLCHICINNEAHESVGGMPTGAVGVCYGDVAKACGYSNVYRVSDMKQLEAALLEVAGRRELSFIEVMVSVGSRDDLGRPKESAVDNKKNFMTYHGVK